MRKLQIGLIGASFFIGSPIGCNNVSNCGPIEYGGNLNPLMAGTVDEALEKKLSRLKVFDKGDLSIFKDFEITENALRERYLALDKLEDIIEDSYGKSPVVVKISHTRCGPCKSSYKEFIYFSRDYPEIKSMHLVIDEDLAGSGTLERLKKEYGFKGFVPSYIVLDKTGEILKETYNLKSVLRTLRRTPQVSDN